MKRLRSKLHQRDLGLIVHIDGDARGVRARKSELDRRLRDSGAQSRATAERAAILVPTWSIETWLLHLTGLAEPLETEQVKRGHAPSPTFATALGALTEAENRHVTDAAAAFVTLPTTLPSLLDGRDEARRVGIS